MGIHLKKVFSLKRASMKYWGNINLLVVGKLNK